MIIDLAIKESGRPPIRGLEAQWSGTHKTFITHPHHLDEHSPLSHIPHPALTHSHHWYLLVAAELSGLSCLRPLIAIITLCWCLRTHHHHASDVEST